MDQFNIRAIEERRRQIEREIEQLRLVELAKQGAQRQSPGVYRAVRRQAGRGLVALGNYLLTRSGEPVRKPGLTAKSEA
jgi:hypothetical protein